ncbi:MAG: hypothetical protein WC269_05150 [Candidatus Gracilibacteria bacterium]|jgi:hypothetical protein
MYQTQQENEVKKKTIAGNKAVLEETAKTAKEKIKQIKEDKTFKNMGKRSEFLSAMIDEMFVLPIDKAKEQAEEKIKTLEKTLANDLGKLNAGISAEVSNFTAYTDQVVETTKGYLNKITEGSKYGKVTEEGLIKMKDSKVKTGNFVKILLKNNDLTDALQGVMGIFKKPGEKTTNFETNRNAVAKLFKYFDKYPKEKSEEVELAFVVLTLMSYEDRKVFTEEYLKTRDHEGKIAFLEYGNLMGAYSPEDMKEFYPEYFNEKLSKKKVNEYSEAFKAQHDFHKKAKKLLTSTYGGTNKAGEMLTLGNTLLFVAQVGAYGTIAGNVITSLFKDGSIQKPSNIIRSILKNEYILGATAVAGGIHMLKQRESWGDYAMNAEDKKTKETTEANNTIYEIRASSPGLSKFMEGENGDNYMGAMAFGDYVHSFTEFDEKKVSIEGFLKWMETKSEKDAQEKAKYEPLIKKINKNPAGQYEFSGAEVDQYQIQDLAKAFSVLNIGGGRINSKDTYTNAIKAVKGTATITTKNRSNINKTAI